MKKSIAALALAQTMAGTLAACSNRDPHANAGAQNGSNSGTGSASAGQVSRRYHNGRDYFDDGYYAAGPNGQVYGPNGTGMTRDLTRDARDIVRDAGDAIGDVGREIGSAARDITGTMNGGITGNSVNGLGTPSWEPDSSAVRY